MPPSPLLVPQQTSEPTIIQCYLVSIEYLASAGIFETSVAKKSNSLFTPYLIPDWAKVYLYVVTRVPQVASKSQILWNASDVIHTIFTFR